MAGSCNGFWKLTLMRIISPRPSIFVTIWAARWRSVPYPRCAGRVSQDLSLRAQLPARSQFDHLVQDGERLPLGQLELLAMHVPGHTPADMAYRVEDAVFVGDTLFMPDVGTARADFPGGDAATLYRSIRRILALPEQTAFCLPRLSPAGRKPQWQTTVQAQRDGNIHA
jgi:glyoxylase-like metal-dependent hydrolase (beta-lactamase superfamily II)